jgi:hypothetical protein
VVAGVLLDALAHFGPYADTLHLGVTPPVVGATVVPQVKTSTVRRDPADTLLTLTTYAGRSGGVTVTVSPGGGTVHADLVAGTETVIQLHGLIGNPTGPQIASVVPDPGAPPIYASAVVSELGYNGPLVGGIALSGGAANVVLPAAQPDIRVPLVDARG